ncbi:hypothetical protein HPB51_005250 [Rhipicephalus microplus]|uniref:C2H2-type domain-containing protein n=1 Tax=Rhipicephalus microplus TaxID=6941 RepID=A0A9J6DZG5_RHIMP|nr:hypothetical protein HPB51_005250 [Rhipicephalus microplus]
MAHVNKSLVSNPTVAPPRCFWRQCQKCPRSFPSRKGLYNHEQRHLNEEAKQARLNAAEGAPSRQPPTCTTWTTSPLQQPSPGPAATPAHLEWWPLHPCRVASTLHWAKRTSKRRPTLPSSQAPLQDPLPRRSCLPPC